MTVAQIDPHVVELAAMSDFSARLQKECVLSSLTQQLFNTWRDLRMRACRRALDNISCTCSELTGLSQAAINFAVGSINGILDGVRSQFMRLPRVYWKEVAVHLMLHLRNRKIPLLPCKLSTSN